VQRADCVSVCLLPGVSRYNRHDKRSKLPNWILSQLKDSHLNLSTDMGLHIVRQVQCSHPSGVDLLRQMLTSAFHLSIFLLTVFSCLQSLSPIVELGAALMLCLDAVSKRNGSALRPLQHEEWYTSHGIRC